MRAIHVSVRVAPVRGALSHGDHGNCACYSLSFIHYCPQMAAPLLSVLVIWLDVGFTVCDTVLPSTRDLFTTRLFLLQAQWCLRGQTYLVMGVLFLNFVVSLPFQ